MNPSQGTNAGHVPDGTRVKRSAMKRFLQKLALKNRRATGEAAGRRRAALAALALLAAGAPAVWAGARIAALACMVLAGVFLAVPFYDTKWKHAGGARRETAARPPSVSYAIATLRPGRRALSDFEIIACGPQFPDWFAIDPIRTAGLGENGFAAYNQRMHAVLETGTEASFCACDRLGNRYDMQALFIGAQRVLLLSRPADAPTRHGAARAASAPPAPAEQAGQVGKGGNELEALGFSISHEIKAPVRAIDGYARIFLEDYGGSLDAEGAQIIGTIRDICRDTILMTNQLLEYTKIRADECGREVVDLAAILKEVFAELRVSYVRAGETRLEVEQAFPLVIGDRVLLRQAMVNILSNSLKFTRDKPVGIIRAGYAVQDGETVFYVRDNGAGFDMQFSQKLFGLFQRMHSPEEFEGSGIGLATVKKIVQKHDGRVWITGAVGQGATVYFTFGPDRIVRQ